MKEHQQVVRHVVAHVTGESVRQPKDWETIFYTEFVKTSCEAGSPWSCLVARTAPSLQQSQSLLMELDLQVVRGTAPRQNPYWQCRPVMLDLLGPGQMALPAQPKEQQMQSLLLKLGLVGLLGVYFRAWTWVNARLWKARVRSGMLPRPL